MVDVLKHRALGRAEMVRAIDVLHNVLILLFDLIEKQSDILQFLLPAVNHIGDLRLHLHRII